MSYRNNDVLMSLSHYDHKSQESPRIDKFQDSWGFVIPLLHYDHESHESPRIDNFLDSWLNRYQFVKFLPVSYIFVVTDSWSIKGFMNPQWVKNIYECLRIDHHSITIAKNALRICYELTTIFWNREFVAKTLNSSKLATNSRLIRTHRDWWSPWLTTNRSLRIYTKLVGTSRTDNDSTTIPENCQFLEIRGILGHSVIGVLHGCNCIVWWNRPKK